MDKKYVVYQHVTPDNMYYFGQTSNIKRRWRNNGAGYKGTALQPYIEKYGWDNIKHIVLFKDQTRENALFIEDFLIETAREDGVCINKQRSGLISKKEGYSQDCNQKYYKQNKQQIREQQKQYYEQNKDKKQQYYEENKDKIKQYYEENKQQIREQQKQYYEENKDKIKQYYEENKQQKREYQRKYYQRKKEEKQLKELGNLPLW